MVTFKHSGNFNNTEKFFKKMQKKDYLSRVSDLAKRGVKALQSVTPMKTGLTASSWSYEIKIENGKTSIFWSNSNTLPDGTPIVILLQYGHATGTGGYVQGRDFINPAIRPIFDEIENQVWKEVTVS